MQDNIKYKINAYIQLLKYVDDGDERDSLVHRVKDLLDIMPDTGYTYSETVYDEYSDSDMRKMLLCIAEMNIDRLMSISEIKRLLKEQGQDDDCTIEQFGRFISRYKNTMSEEDGISIKIKRRGTGSNLYRICKEGDE